MSARADLEVHVTVGLEIARALKLICKRNHFIHFRIHGILRADDYSIPDDCQELLNLLLLVEKLLNVASIVVNWDLLEDFQIP